MQNRFLIPFISATLTACLPGRVAAQLPTLEVKPTASIAVDSNFQSVACNSQMQSIVLLRGDERIEVWNYQDVANPRLQWRSDKPQPGTTDVDFHPSGNRLVTTNADGSITTIEISPAEGLTKREHSQPLRRIFASPAIANQVFATGDAGMSLLYDCQTDQFLGALDVISTTPPAAVFSRGGKRLYVAAADAAGTAIRQFNIPEANQLEPLATVAGSVSRLRMSLHGRWLMAVTSDGITTWDVENQIERFSLRHPPSEQIVDVCDYGDSQAIAALCSSGWVYLWKAGVSEPRARFRVGLGGNSLLPVASSTPHLAICTTVGGGRIHLCSTVPLVKASGLPPKNLADAFIDNPRMLEPEKATSTGSAMRADRKPGNQRSEDVTPPKPLFSRPGSLIDTPQSPAVKVTLRHELNALSNSGFAIALSPDEKVLAAAGLENYVTLLDTSGGHSLRQLKPVDGMVLGLLWFPDNQRLVTIGDKNSVIVWDTVSGKRLGTVMTPGRASRIDWIEPGKVAVVASLGQLLVCDLVEMRVISAEPVLKRITGLQFVSPGQPLYLCGEQTAGDAVKYVVGQYRLGQSDSFVALAENSAMFDGIHRSSDGRYLAACALKGAVVAIDLENQNRVVRWDTLQEFQRNPHFLLGSHVFLVGGSGSFAAFHPEVRQPLLVHELTKPGNTFQILSTRDRRRLFSIHQRVSMQAAEFSLTLEEPTLALIPETETTARLADELYLNVEARQKPPSEEARRSANAELLAVFGDQLTQANKIDSKGLDQLLAAARDATTTASHYEILQIAYRLSLQKGDADRATSATQSLIKAYDLDGIKTYGSLIWELSKRSASIPLPSRQELCRLTANVTEYAVLQCRWNEALVLAQAGSKLASEARLRDLAVQFKQTSERLSREKVRYEAASIAQRTLMLTREDLKAATDWGRFLCFAAGEWELGLKWLARGNDVELKDLALRSLANPSHPSSQLELAEKWLAWISRQDREVIDLESTRGATSAPEYWLKSALPNLTGIEKIKAQKLLDSIPTE